MAAVFLAEVSPDAKRPVRSLLRQDAHRVSLILAGVFAYTALVLLTTAGFPPLAGGVALSPC